MTNSSEAIQVQIYWTPLSTLRAHRLYRNNRRRTRRPKFATAWRRA